MFERVKKLHDALTGADKAELGLLHNAYIEWTHTFGREKTAANRKEWSAARDALSQAVDRLWPQAFPHDAAKAVGPVFKDKAAAFSWYTENGGQRQKSSFYTSVPADGKKVSRLAVSEMLRKERPASSSGVDLTARKELADTLKAEAEARIKERQDEREARELDRDWIRRENAEEEICVWTSRLRDAVAYHLGKILTAIIHAAGGHPGRLAEVQSIIDSALAAAANEIADNGEITVTIEALEDTPC